MRTEQDQLQRDRLARLLEELEQEHGPIDPQVIEAVRQAWPLPDVSTAKLRDA